MVYGDRLDRPVQAIHIMLYFHLLIEYLVTDRLLVQLLLLNIVKFVFHQLNKASSFGFLRWVSSMYEVRLEFYHLLIPKDFCQGLGL
jgi:hypothetical protein